MANLGKMSEEMFAKLKGGIKGGIKTIGKMSETEFQELKNSILKPKPRQLLNAEISAYSASKDETDDNPNETSTGTRTRVGIAASNNEALYGKKVKIEDQIYTIEDTMNERYRKAFKNSGKLMFDIVKSTKKEALDFGRKNLFIEILD